MGRGSLNQCSRKFLKERQVKRLPARLTGACSFRAIQFFYQPPFHLSQKSELGLGLGPRLKTLFDRLKTRFRKGKQVVAQP